MLGNLSKVLIKAPNFFNNMKTEEIKQGLLYNIPEEEDNVLNPFNSIKVVKTQGNNNNKNIYFREKDFWKKNLLLDINYNHNKRLPPLFPDKREVFHKISKSNKHKSVSFENKNLSLTPKTVVVKKFILDQLNNRYLLPEEKVKELNNTLKNEVNNIINKKNDTTFLMFKNNTINACESNDVDNNNRSKSNVIVREKFPKLNSLIKSQESLFQDNIDRRLNSLRNIKPEVKEQLKEKNRYIVGKRDFLAYKNLNRINLKNPFFESIKMKEKLNLETLK